MKISHLIALWLLLCVSACTSSSAFDTSSTTSNPSLTQYSETKGMTPLAGFINLYKDESQGRVLASFPAPNENGNLIRAIYSSGLTAGLGSNPIGLDRGYFNSGVIVSFRRIGNKVVAEQENWNYRATSDNPKERKAVRQSFAPSFLWASEILETANDGSILVDLSGFLTHDQLGIAAAIARNKNGGQYALDDKRSFPDLNRTYAFPDNIELDAYITLSSSKPGSEPTNTAADGRSITLVQHTSLVRLPDDGFKTRRFDPRTAAIEVAYYDFSNELHDPIVSKLARRFRLERIDPNATFGPVKKPLVFYVDSGAPEQIRDALIEGASWWADAFTAAGFENAFRVEVLPEGVHPLDIRYNVIQWVHRQTRGWSYGGGVVDPRTGEMLKADVILGSQRVRQDRMIFEGLAGAENSGKGGDNDPVQIALRRIRQLAAHEVGHTLGFAHNFAASSNNRASVMDYPAPHITPDDQGGLDFSQAYAVGMGDWDIFTVKWLYSQFPEGASEEAELEKLIEQANTEGLRFVADSEARSVATANPYGSVWDNGEDATKSLEETLQVRRIALDNFGLRALQSQQPISDLRNVLVPIYLYHRYQTAAASKQIGGLEFSYGVKDSLAPTTITPVTNNKQEAALTAILRTLQPTELDLSDDLLTILAPEAGGFTGFGRNTELFTNHTGVGIDVLSAADTAATITLSALLNPKRAARLVEQNRRDASMLSFESLLSKIEETIFRSEKSPRLKTIAEVTQNRYIESLISLIENSSASAHVRAVAEQSLQRITKQLNKGTALQKSMLSAIKRHQHRQADAVAFKSAEPEIPPGSPIGSLESCWHCD